MYPTCGAVDYAHTDSERTLLPFDGGKVDTLRCQNERKEVAKRQYEGKLHANVMLTAAKCHHR